MTAELLIEPTCGNCLHWRRVPAPGALKQMGNCYRFPPTPALVNIQTPLGPQTTTAAIRPPVAADEPPCGDHRPKDGEMHMVPLDWNRWQEPQEVIEVDAPVESPTTESAND